MKPVTQWYTAYDFYWGVKTVTFPNWPGRMCFLYQCSQTGSCSVCTNRHSFVPKMVYCAGESMSDLIRALLRGSKDIM